MKKKKRVDKDYDFTHDHDYVVDLLFIAVISLGIFYLAGSFSLIRWANTSRANVLSAQSENVVEIVEVKDSPRIIPPKPCEACNN
jgi:hypothetical protein